MVRPLVERTENRKVVLKVGSMVRNSVNNSVVPKVHSMVVKKEVDLVGQLVTKKELH
jgi:hypothetical protein